MTGHDCGCWDGGTKPGRSCREAENEADHTDSHGSLEGRRQVPVGYFALPQFGEVCRATKSVMFGFLERYFTDGSQGNLYECLLRREDVV